jgi:hypothetical protein
MRVFQSVVLSSNAQKVRPALETVVQGFLVPGKRAITHPDGMGTWHWCAGSPFAIPKLHDCSVVADESDGD